MRSFRIFLCLFVAGAFSSFARDYTKDLAVGVAGHAFDHLGNIGEQADAAVASGANIIYVSGLGGCGYMGLPPEEEFAKQKKSTSTYVAGAKAKGIRLAIGYVCATSIVKLKDFDRNWPEKLRSAVHSAPAEWRQQDRAGKPLKSWYDGDYEPACMNNPDWRAYEKFIIRQQLEAGCEGIFFDNPTVHPQGCYCKYCMQGFERYLHDEQRRRASPGRTRDDNRAYAASHAAEFMKFRCTIARDFFREMRDYARSVKNGALITANNSLNSAEVLYAQCRNYAYNIHEMSKTEDFVVVEDMSSQPRVVSGGRTIEYGPTYKQLSAISHGKPVVAVTIADSDYHTAPNLVRLAMAEAAANDASYLSWPTWPTVERKRMEDIIRPQAEFMRTHAELFAGTRQRRDVVLFLPFRRWVETADCVPSRVASALSRANFQYEVCCEDQMKSSAALKGAKAFVADLKDLNVADKQVAEQFIANGGKIVSPTQPEDALLKSVRESIGQPSITLHGPATIRAVVRDQGKRTLVHLLNLNLQKLSSFQDRVTPAENVKVELSLPFRRVRSATLFSPDENETQPLEYQTRMNESGSILETTVPQVKIAAILVIQ